jgi:hypothetical protein
MSFTSSVDAALDALRNTSLPSELNAGLSADALAAINPALAKRKFPPLPEDYLYLLGKTNGCDGPGFYLYGIEHIDTAAGTIDGAIVEEAEDFNRDEAEDDIADKGHVLGHMYGRMMLVYRHGQYHVLDTDSRLPLADIYDDIGAFILSCIRSAEKKASSAADSPH